MTSCDLNLVTASFLTVVEQSQLSCRLQKYFVLMTCVKKSSDSFCVGRKTSGHFLTSAAPEGPKTGADVVSLIWDISVAKQFEPFFLAFLGQ